MKTDKELNKDKKPINENNKKVCVTKKFHLRVDDSVLGAVQEAQPFEEAAHLSQCSQVYFGIVKEQIINDVFGIPIINPDLSNPTRSRDERPLDTIRGFEYSISGDPILLTKLETNKLGFNIRNYYSDNSLHNR